MFSHIVTFAQRLMLLNGLLLLTLLVAAVMVLREPEAAHARDDRPSPAEEMGFPDARDRLGNDLPLGRGVVMGHVEGGKAAYLPDLEASRFEGVEFTPVSGPSHLFKHAQQTAAIAYGPRGLAPGVEDVRCYRTSHWLGGGFLRTGTPLPPAKAEVDVFSHSWVSDSSGHAEEILRRVDLVADRDDTVFCVGVNNGRPSRVPRLLASAYNVIAVGTDSGASSGAYTRVEGEGRCKPDIVGPQMMTSFTTPMVASCAARLIEAGRRLEGSAAARARRSETIKAILLAGATKPWNWAPAKGKPLDERLGAGLVNVDHALEILLAGPAKPLTDAGEAAWDFRSAMPDSRLAYRFENDEPGRDISVALTWHRRVAGRSGFNVVKQQPQWLDPARLADFDLVLHYTSPSGQTGVIGRSESGVDNVEHIFIEQAPPGEYRLEVVRRPDGHDEPWDYAVAWRVGEAELQ
ncbi:MAG: hypothetical protein ACOCTI_08450 [Phycisphaeraceae bacterium]